MEIPVLAGRATKYLPDGRVRHYWDADGQLVRDFVPVLGMQPDARAWDVHLLYDKNAAWGGSPQATVRQEQLGISEETQLDGPKLAEAIKTIAAK